MIMTSGKLEVYRTKNTILFNIVVIVVIWLHSRNLLGVVSILLKAVFSLKFALTSLSSFPNKRLSFNACPIDFRIRTEDLFMSLPFWKMKSIIN